jgi:hypothetical protein
MMAMVGGGNFMMIFGVAIMSRIKGCTFLRRNGIYKCQ